MSSSDLCNLLNEFYEDIRPDLAQSVFSAIQSAQHDEEFENNPEIFNSLRRLILSLANPQEDDSFSINIYMTSNNTQDSSTRPFFYHMLLPGNVNPQDNLVVPPAPPAFGLQLRPTLERDAFERDAHAMLFISPPDPSLPVALLPPIRGLPSSFPPLPLSFTLPSFLPPIGYPQASSSQVQSEDIEDIDNFYN
jgi:hypothetical protein